MSSKDYILFFSGLTLGSILGLALGLVPQLKPVVTTARPTKVMPTTSRPSVKDMEARLRALVARKPKDLHNLTRLANFLFDQERFQEAIPYYQQALKIQPENPDLRTDMGIAYRRVGKMQQAQQAFEQAQRAAPQHWQSLYNLGTLYKEELHKPQQAAACFAKILSIAPQKAEDLAVIAQAFYKAHEFDSCLRLLKKALKIAPDYWQALYLLAFFYEDHRQDYRQALQYYQKLLQRLPAGHNKMQIQKRIKMLQARLSHPQSSKK